jgi:hypothetical protein
MAAQHDNDVMSHMNEAPNPPLAAFSVCAHGAIDRLISPPAPCSLLARLATTASLHCA